MTGSSDFEREISRSIGAIEASVENLKERAEEDRALQNARHAENKEALKGVADELKRRAAVPETMSRARLATLASIGLVTVYVVGWAIQSGLGWAIDKLLKMKFGG